MKSKLVLAFLLGISLTVIGVAAWHFTRPSVADNLSTQANGMLNQWKVPTVAPTAKTTKATTTVTVKEPTPALHSSGWGVIKIPVLNLTLPLVEGIDEYTDLSKGVGHYSALQEPHVTQTMPGQVGNFAVAGHVNGPFAPFENLYKLRTGDKIIITTRTSQYTYRVVDGTACGSSRSVVHMSKVQVIFPNPCSNATPTKSLITLTTCSYPYGTKPPATYRLIIWGELSSVAYHD